MSARLMVHRSGSPPEEVALTEPATLGGGSDDAVRVEGSPPRALELSPSPAGVLVETLAAGAALRLSTGSVRTLASGRRRVLRPGESLRMGAATLEVAAEPPPSTRVLAGRLLGDAGRGDEAAGPHLLALEGPDAGRRLALGDEATLGRGQAATLHLSDACASRRHARVSRSGGGFTLEDLGSKNGLRLDGAPVGRSPAPLRPGDEIAVGESVLALVLPAGATPPVEEASVPRPPLPARPSPPRAALAAAAALLASAAALAAAALGA